MTARFGGRHFLGCAKYPMCKGTKQPSAKLLGEIAAAVPV